MANFRMYNGMMVEVTKQLKSLDTKGKTLEPGEIHQLLRERFTDTIRFVGVNGIYGEKYMGQFIKPLEYKECIPSKNTFLIQNLILFSIITVFTTALVYLALVLI